MGGLERIGQLLPALEHLVLDDGRLSSLRQLGTNLTELRSLSAARVGICNLNGFGALRLDLLSHFIQRDVHFFNFHFHIFPVSYLISPYDTVN